MKKNIIIIVLLTFTLHSVAQQNSILNQYIFNPMSINPAYVGTKQWTNINISYSSPWINFKGAPSTQMISADGALSQSMGLGVQLINEKTGAQCQQGLYGSYSYIVKLNKKFNLSMGLTAGISNFAIDGTELNPETIDDNYIPVNRQNSLRFDPKFGLFLYSERFYAGLSITDMLGDMIKNYNGFKIAQARHYYLTAGYVFDINQDVKIKPSFLLREDFKAQTNMDLTAHFLFKETFWFGATYRFGMNILTSPELGNNLKMRDAVVLMTEWNIDKSWIVGYAYTHSVTALSSWSGHELILSYTFPAKVKTRMKSPRYF
ncbi:MAG: type IX secretion system membrane protein PorP/SprF [Bacteroidales bacterium]|jgi:type IX secretion system PorP/SprF family membrane protein|nr:type IX secretion system membrane protein PorP/SprF [Bacteroidales bacterium]